jgi:acyl-CoA dehydrogenase family protein 9
MSLDAKKQDGVKKFNPIIESGPAKNLFLGEILEESIFPYPTYTDEERETVSSIVDSIDKLMQDKQSNFRDWDVAGAQPEEYIQELRDFGLFGLSVPEEMGGIGLSSSGYGRAVQQISSHDASSSLTIAAHTSIGFKGLILFGNEEQKAKYYPKLASGEMIAAFCLTEPGSGSDAGSIRTNAVKNEDGTWTLNGEKIWITNGPIAEFFTVFAKTGQDKGKLSAFIVERSFGGVSSGHKEDKMGIRASSTCTVRFDNVRVPAENLLGIEGHGFKIAMSILNNGRAGLGAGCLGAMKQCINLAIAHAAERKQFGKSIGEFQLIKEKLSNMVVACYATESLVHLTGRLIDEGVKDYSLESAMCKIFGSESLWAVSNDALQIAGGTGYMREYPYERVVRDSRINLIFEGTNEVLRLFIALTGMKDAGQLLKEVGGAAANIFNEPIKGFGLLTDYAKRRLVQGSGVGRDKIGSAHELLRPEATIIEIYALRLATAVDAVLRVHGSKIVDKQLIAKRLSDVAIDLMVSLAMLSRVSASLNTKTVEQVDPEIQILRLFIAQAKRRMNQNLRRLMRNEDQLVDSLGTKLVEGGKYLWDTI